MRYLKSTAITNAIRSTTPVVSGRYTIDGFADKTLVVLNGTNQSVSLTFEYSPNNGTTWYPIDAATSINATTNTVLTEAQIPALRLVKGDFRFTATCSVAPTSGTLLIELHQSIR